MMDGVCQNLHSCPTLLESSKMDCHFSTSELSWSHPKEWPQRDPKEWPQTLAQPIFTVADLLSAAPSSRETLEGIVVVGFISQDVTHFP